LSKSLDQVAKGRKEAFKELLPHHCCLFFALGVFVNRFVEEVDCGKCTQREATT